MSTHSNPTSDNDHHNHQTISNTNEYMSTRNHILYSRNNPFPIYSGTLWTQRQLQTDSTLSSTFPYFRYHNFYLLWIHQWLENHFPIHDSNSFCSFESSDIHDLRESSLLIRIQSETRNIEIYLLNCLLQQ